MKKAIALFIMTILGALSYAQSKEEMLSEIEGKWKLDDNGNVTYVRIVEVPDLKKEEIYNRALNYFTYNYGSGKSVIQIQDKESGLIVGKGLYENVHINLSLLTTYIDTWHILRVDIKEGKARIVLTLTQYDSKGVGGNTPPSFYTRDVAQEYPINPKGTYKSMMTKAFYKTHQRAIASLDAIEKAIKEGNTSKAIEGESW